MRRDICRGGWKGTDLTVVGLIFSFFVMFLSFFVARMVFLPFRSIILPRRGGLGLFDTTGLFFLFFSLLPG